MTHAPFCAGFENSEDGGGDDDNVHIVQQRHAGHLFSADNKNKLGTSLMHVDAMWHSQRQYILAQMRMW